MQVYDYLTNILNAKQEQEQTLIERKLIQKPRDQQAWDTILQQHLESYLNDEKNNGNIIKLDQERTPEGRPIIHWLIENRYWQCALYAVQKGCPFDSKNEFNQDVLFTLFAKRDYATALEFFNFLYINNWHVLASQLINQNINLYLDHFVRQASSAQLANEHFLPLAIHVIEHVPARHFTEAMWMRFHDKLPKDPVHSIKPLIEKMEQRFKRDEEDIQWLTDMTNQILLSDRQDKIAGLTPLYASITEKQKSQQAVVESKKSLENQQAENSQTVVHRSHVAVSNKLGKNCCAHNDEFKQRAKTLRQIR